GGGAPSSRRGGRGRGAPRRRRARHRQRRLRRRRARRVSNPPPSGAAPAPDGGAQAGVAGVAPGLALKPRRLPGDRGKPPLALVWSSFFGSGYFPLAPGTAGTAAAI